MSKRKTGRILLNPRSPTPSRVRTSLAYAGVPPREPLLSGKHCTYAQATKQPSLATGHAIASQLFPLVTRSCCSLPLPLPLPSTQETSPGQDKQSKLKAHFTSLLNQTITS